jgi:hypothetical protein
VVDLHTMVIQVIQTGAMAVVATDISQVRSRSRSKNMNSSCFSMSSGRVACVGATAHTDRGHDRSGHRHSSSAPK